MNKRITIEDLTNIDLLGASHPTKQAATELTIQHLILGATALNLSLRITSVEILFNLTGRSAGQASYRYKAQKRKAPLSLDDLCDLDILNPSANISCGPAHQIEPKAYALRIRLNYPLMCANPGEFFKHTIPHEVAHILSVCAHGKAGHGHGAHWRRICATLGMEDVTRCHSYDTTATRKAQRRWDYTCTCPEHNVHKLSTTLHNKIKRGTQTRRCTTCGATLQFTGYEG